MTTDTFTAMFPRRPRLDADGARQNVAEMRAATPMLAAVRLMTLATGPAGNLTDGAREVYLAEIARLTARREAGQ